MKCSYLFTVGCQAAAAFELSLLPSLRYVTRPEANRPLDWTEAEPITSALPGVGPGPSSSHRAHLPLLATPIHSSPSSVESSPENLARSIAVLSTGSGSARATAEASSRAANFLMTIRRGGRVLPLDHCPSGRFSFLAFPKVPPLRCIAAFAASSTPPGRLTLSTNGLLVSSKLLASQNCAFRVGGPPISPCRRSPAANHLGCLSPCSRQTTSPCVAGALRGKNGDAMPFNSWPVRDRNHEFGRSSALLPHDQFSRSVFTSYHAPSIFTCTVTTPA